MAEMKPFSEGSSTSNTGSGLNIKSSRSKSKFAKYNDLHDDYSSLIASLRDVRKEITETAKELATISDKESEEAKKKKERLDKLKEAEQELAKEAEKTGNKLQKSAADLVEGVGRVVSQVLGSVTEQSKKAINDLVSSQESMAYNLQGSKDSLGEIIERFQNTFNATGFVKQSEVYKNLTDLVQSGIIYNSESRAYLATIADDLGMSFNVKDQALTRLINIQREDLTSNRMAIQASLKTFLNQNYQTSQYIKEGFSSVSSALIDTQAWMTKEGASQFESVVQQWLGSMSSVGVSTNTVNEIATALNQLGSGNISGLAGSRMGNLMFLGAQSGSVDISDVLNNGLSAADANKLLSGITTYLQGVATNESNVVKSAFTDMLGIGMADLRAIANMPTNFNKQGIISDDIGTLLDKLTPYSRTAFFGNESGLIPITTMINNIMENMTYGRGLDVGNDTIKYLTYEMIKSTSDVAGTVLDGISTTLGFMGSGVTTALSTVAKIAPDLMLSGLGGGLISPDIIKAIVNGVDSGRLSAKGIFDKLNNTSGMTSLSNGDLTGMIRTTGLSDSGSIIINNAGSDDYTNMASTTATREKKKIDDQVVEKGVTVAEIQDQTVLTQLGYLNSIDSNILQIYNFLVDKLSATPIRSASTTGDISDNYSA